MKITFHAAALAESEQVSRYYGSQGETLRDRFNSEFDRAISLIAAVPDRWPVDKHGLRCYRLKVFPYSIRYRIKDDEIRILIVRHHARHPDYGIDRT